MTYLMRQVLGIILLVIPFLLFALLVGAWPANRTGTGDAMTVSGLSAPLNDILGGSPEVRLLVIVMIAGAVGSAIHAAKVFAMRIGTQSFEATWLWWYLLRFPTGVGMALLVYLVIRGALFAGNFGDQAAAVSAVNPFGLAALAALTGMFSRQATDKLEEIFEGIFRTAERSDRPAAPPLVESIPPVRQGATGTALKVSVKGRNFFQGAKALIDAEERPARWVSSSELQVTLLPKDVAEVGKLKLTITNPPDKGGGKVIADVIVESV